VSNCSGTEFLLLAFLIAEGFVLHVLLEISQRVAESDQPPAAAAIAASASSAASPAVDRSPMASRPAARAARLWRGALSAHLLFGRRFGALGRIAARHRQRILELRRGFLRRSRAAIEIRHLDAIGLPRRRQLDPRRNEYESRLIFRGPLLRRRLNDLLRQIRPQERRGEQQHRNDQQVQDDSPATPSRRFIADPDWLDVAVAIVEVEVHQELTAV
jgi:hypothetical protein